MHGDGKYRLKMSTVSRLAGLLLASVALTVACGGQSITEREDESGGTGGGGSGGATGGAGANGGASTSGGTTGGSIAVGGTGGGGEGGSAALAGTSCKAGGPCMDPDGSTDDPMGIHVPSTTVGTNGELTDGCDPDGNVVEYYCETNCSAADAAPIPATGGAANEPVSCYFLGSVAATIVRCDREQHFFCSAGTCATTIYRTSTRPPARRRRPASRAPGSIPRPVVASLSHARLGIRQRSHEGNALGRALTRLERGVKRTVKPRATSFALDTPTRSQKSDAGSGSGRRHSTTLFELAWWLRLGTPTLPLDSLAGQV